MSEPVGRAGFHVTHTKSLGERAAILHEAMRELDPKAVEYWAARNSNIVVEDEPLNEAMVNDGAGGFRRCVSWNEVLDYGSGRAARVRGGVVADKLDKNGERRGGTVTTSLLVAHLPKSMCREIPGYYPRLNDDGSPMLDPESGEPLCRSRWVARDRDEARKYFEDVVDFLAENAIPGGHAGILGYDIQHSESTPHIQIIADTFGEVEGSKELRKDWSRKWSSHRDVRDENGRQISGPAKMRAYHADLKRYLIERGYEISPDFDEERHLIGHTKADFARVSDLAERTNRGLSRLNAREMDQKFRESRLRRDRETLEADREELPRLRHKAKEDGLEEGRREAREEVEIERREIERLRRQVEADRRATAAARRAAEAAQAQAVKTLNEVQDAPKWVEQWAKRTGNSESLARTKRMLDRSLAEVRALVQDEPTPRESYRGREFGE